MPVITAQPESQTISAGSNVTFTVTASGSEPLSYQWQFNGTNLSDNAHITGSRTNTLTIYSVQHADRGAYSVVITNAAGSVTSTNAPLIIDNDPVPLVMGIVDNHNGTVTISFPSIGGCGYWVMWSDEPPDMDWVFLPLARNVGSGGTMSLTDYRAVPTRCYKLMTDQPPPLFSTNKVGYVNLTAQPGSNWVFNPFKGITLDGAMPNPPDMTEVVLTNQAGSYSRYWFDAYEPGWFDEINWDPAGSTNIPAGQSFLVLAPDQFSFALVGEVSPDVTNWPPTITAQPQSHAVAVCQNATFTATAVSSTPLGYQWRFNGVDIPGATGSSYTRLNVQTNDAGSYWVVVTNAIGSTVSSAAILGVVFCGLPPCTPVSSIIGGTSTNCPPDYWDQRTPGGHWFWGINNYDDEGDLFTAAPGGPWWLESVQIAAWVYSDLSGTDRAVASIRADNHGSPGAILASCLVSGFGNNEPAIATGSFPAGISLIGGNSYWLTIHVFDGQKNWCIQGTTMGLETYGNDTAGWTVIGPGYQGSFIVLGHGPTNPPVITTQPEGRIMMPPYASNVTFTVAASGTAPLAYQWRFNGTNLTDNAHLSGAPADSLTIFNVQTNDAGSYSVVVTNAGGSVTSSVAILIWPPPLPAPGSAGGVITLIGITFGGGVGSLAYIQGHISPPEAVLAGAGWRLHGSGTGYYSDPSHTEAVSQGGNPVIECSAVPGWDGPTNRGVSVTLGTVTVFDGVYMRSAQLGVSAPTGFASSGYAGGPFTPDSLSYTLTNSGDASLEWWAAQTPDWLTLSAVGGTLAGGQSTSLSVNLNANANSLTPSSYSGTLAFANLSNSLGNIAYPASLLVRARPPELSGASRLTNGAIAMVLQGSVGGVYSIRIATDLLTPLTNWLTLATVTLTNTSQLCFDTPVPGQARRFYRAVLLP